MAHTYTSKITGRCLLSALIGSLLILSPHALAQTPRFLPVVNYDSGGYLANSVVVGDLNGDGILDVVVSHKCAIGDTCPNGQGYTCWLSEWCSPGAVGVLLGNGDGTFQPAVTYETDGYIATSIRLGDLNGDGKLDIAVVNACGTLPDSNEVCPYGTVDVMFGKGDGTFGPPLGQVLAGWYPVSVSLGDLDGDGHLDMALANVCLVQSTCSEGDCRCETGSAEVLLNMGGWFRETIYDSGGPWGRSVALADVNRDGKIDVLLANSGSVGVLLGNGDGTLQSAVAYSSGVSTSGFGSLAVDDVNEDDKPDVLAAGALGCSNGSCTYQGVVGVLLGKGDGTFQPTVIYGSGASFASSVVVSDVNGDSTPDLAVTNDGGRALGVLLGSGDGTFQVPVTFDSGRSMNESVAVGDLNGDGKPDVIIGNGGVGVLLNDTPFCTTAPTITISTTPTSLWPPKGEMAPVTVSGAIRNSGTNCSIKTAIYSVKDEYGKLQPRGTVTLDEGGAYSFTVWLQALRLGTDLDGRLYTVTISATNDARKTGSQSGTVIVPHDQGR